MVDNTKAIRIDKELIDTLAEKRVGFETPNDCLKRLLNHKPCSEPNQIVSKVEEDDS